MGIVGTLVVGLSIFFICKRKRRKQTDNEQEIKEKRTSDQFANDFETIDRPSPTHNSPIMQQHQLQLRLIQQLQIPKSHQRSSSSSPLLPPPPYCP